MGYKRARKVYVLSFEDEEFEGLEIKVKSLSMKEMLEVSKLENKTDPESIKLLLSVFAEKVVSWNLEDEDGTPMPVTVDSLINQDPEFIGACIGSWIHAVSAVPDPLSKASENGTPSLVASIPMETL